MSTILTTNNLRKSYKKHLALKGLSIRVEAGQIFGLLGPNGSGKTTTLGILLGIIKPNSGDYSWFGKGELDENRIQIGALLETPNFYPYLNAVDNLKIVAKIKNLDNAKERIEEVLKQVELWHRKKAKFREYSLGMKQRLAIASALLANPKVLILDEPTNGLDPSGIAEIRQLILDIAASGKTIILASHLLDEVEKLCTHLAILKEGELIQQGSIEEILSQKRVLAISADSLDNLKATIETIPSIEYIETKNSEILISIDENLTPSEVNKLFVEKGVYLSSLSIRKTNLEAKFLEIIS